MALVNVRNSEIQLKIVYYGPGRAGKTTCLEYIREKLAKQAGSRIVQVKTPEQRTLFFDFYPLMIGKVKGFDVRVQLYSVPGQSRLHTLRNLVLNGVDSVVFVADAMTIRRKNNIESFKSLVENLKSYKKELIDIPLAIQLNKMDLAEEQIPVISMSSLRSDLSGCLGDDAFLENIPLYETSAISGKNILKTLESVIKSAIREFDFNAVSEKG